MDRTDIQSLRQRALELAEEGGFNHWEEIGFRLQREGFATALEVLEADQSLRMMLNARCAAAKRP
jgi:hypothetical protein